MQVLSHTSRAAQRLALICRQTQGHTAAGGAGRFLSADRQGNQHTSAASFRTAAASSAAGAAAASVSANPDTMEVVRVPALSDNYIWLLHEPKSNLTAVVDPAEVEPVNRVLQERGWKLDYIFNTHHHWDHTGGNEALKAQHNLQVVGPKADAARIPGIDVQLADGDVFKFGELEMRVFDTPGHTRGHVTYWLPEAKALFPGDTLFALGCGRLFEGHPEMMWTSLSKLLPLPRDTLVYCAHEYTQSNARFAVTVDPNNEALQKRKEAIDAARKKGEATVPSLLADELATNPFLRPHDAGIRAAVKADAGMPDWEVFGRVRTAKDQF